jgi:hypothetical protein
MYRRCFRQLPIQLALILCAAAVCARARWCGTQDIGSQICCGSDVTTGQPITCPSNAVCGAVGCEEQLKLDSWSPISPMLSGAILGLVIFAVLGCCGVCIRRPCSYCLNSMFGGGDEEESEGTRHPVAAVVGYGGVADDQLRSPPVSYETFLAQAAPATTTTIAPTSAGTVAPVAE